MKQDGPKKIHFLGIGGSGASAAAIIAKKSGFDVTGCNQSLDTPYLKTIKDHKIKLFKGHDPEHVKDVDVLATSPALFFSDQQIEELELAKKQKTVMSWQRFVGEYLLNDKKVIAVSGSHGKSTTTAMLGLMLEQAKKDPTVLIGANVKEWEANFRWGNSEFFVIEADEFYNNFLNYKPDILLINNIEFEHPDFFKNEEDVFSSFKRFIQQLKGNQIIIVNQDSPGVLKVLNDIKKMTIKNLKLIGYSTGSKIKFNFDFFYQAKKIQSKNGKYSYEVKLTDDNKITIELNVAGFHNVSNSLGVVAVMDQMGLDVSQATQTLKKFSGVGRRTELISKKNGIKIYDDYAHHPTEIKATLNALREIYPKKKLIAIIEPHSFIRTRKLLSLYDGIFESSDNVVIGPIFKARDDQDYGVSGNDIVRVSKHKNIEYIERPERIYEAVKAMKTDDAVIIVMGAGNSYKWARSISELL